MQTSTFQRTVRAIHLFQRTLCCVCIVGITVLIATEVFVRSAFFMTLGFAHEVSNYLLVSAAFFGFAVALADEKLFRIDLFGDRLPEPVTRGLTLVFDILSLIFAIIVFCYLTQAVESTFRLGMRSATSLGVPLYIPQSMMPLGMFMVIVTLVIRLLGRLSPSSQDH